MELTYKIRHKKSDFIDKYSILIYLFIYSFSIYSIRTLEVSDV